MTTKSTLPYFAHEAHARNTNAMMRLRMAHGVAGYGVYYMLLERLRVCDSFEADYDIEVLSFDFRCEPELIQSVILDFGLFILSEDGKKFHSIELTEKMEAMMEARRIRQEIARRAAEARWGRRQQTETVSDSAIDKEGEIIDTLNDEIVRLKADEEWKDAIRNEFDITEQELIDHIDAFRLNCVCNGLKNGHLDHKGNVDMINATKHCRAYIRKMVRPNKGTATTYETPSPISDKLSKAENERLKDFNERTETQRKEATREKMSQSGDNICRNMGYDPKICKIWQVFNEEWRSVNPPTHPEWIGMFPGRETVEEVEKRLASKSA